MRPRLGMLALAPIALMLGGCPAPDTATISITNNSGQRIAFTSCRGDKYDLAPGEAAELLNEYRYIGGPNAWGCYRKRPLVVATDGGESWSYTLWVNRDFVTRPGHRGFAEFEESESGPRGYSPHRVRVPVEIAPDGSIRAGEWRREDRDGPYLRRGAKPVFPTDPQPPGFPIVPKRSPHTVRK